jgi:hypothetical protein
LYLPLLLSSWSIDSRTWRAAAVDLAPYLPVLLHGELN